MRSVAEHLLRERGFDFVNIAYVRKEPDALEYVLYSDKTDLL